MVKPINDTNIFQVAEPLIYRTLNVAFNRL